MLKSDVVEFFDRLAPGWDSGMIKNDRLINTILDNAGVNPGVRVLDVACGTGVLFPDYLERSVEKLVGIDISPAMAKISRKKYIGNPKVTVVTGDVEETTFDEGFDCIVVYNAFPHFSQPERLIKHLSSLLVSGGTLTVAHGMSRKHLDHHHSGSASKVSIGLMSEIELSEIFSHYLDVTTAISNDEMYQVAGRKALDTNA